MEYLHLILGTAKHQMETVGKETELKSNFDYEQECFVLKDLYKERT
jgi:hypothetical protein